MEAEHSALSTERTAAQEPGFLGWANCNGEILPAHEARVSVYDRGFLFGDSIYEVIRTYHGVLYTLDKHLARLRRSAEALGMEHLIDEARLTTEINRTVQAAGYDESYIRLIITRGVGRIGLQVRLAEHPNTIIIVQPFHPPHEIFYERGLRLAVVSVTRNLAAALNPAVKSGNYLNSLLALREAELCGADEAAMLNNEGYLTEATTSNIFLVYDGELVTPPLTAGILEGVTRGVILSLAAQERIPYRLALLTLDQVLQAQECFISSSIKEIVPVTTINDRPVGDGLPGPLTKRLANIFRSHVGLSPRYPLP